MCGIAGILGASSLVDRRSIVQAMIGRLAHRGPDGEGVLERPTFVFGHRRLAIIDIEHGTQPMVSEDGRYSIVFNGEIYNYLELRQRLTQHGHRFRTHSDTEVLLSMLIEENAAALRHLNGMFAFAFHDRQTGEWLVGRDQFGIKPLYYAELGGTVVFASEIKALLAHPELRSEVDWPAMQQYMTFQFCLGEKTLFRRVRKLEPGCYLVGAGGKISEMVRYWDTRYQVDEHHTETYFVDRLRGLVEDSVHLQLRSDVPVGAYLSGGLDSSVVSMIAADRLGAGIDLFHGRFAEGPQYDESAFARTVADAANSKLNITVPTAEDFVSDLPRLIYAMDEPVAGPGLFPQYRVSKMAAERVKVVLGGQGGDEVFGGYARYLVGYLEQALKGAIFETQEEGKHVVTLASIISNLPLLQQYQPLMQNFWRDGLFSEMDARYFRIIDRSPDLEAILTDDALKSFDRASVFSEFQKIFNHPDTRSYFNKMTHFDMKTLLPSLLQVEDRVSMAVSLESRVPLLDTRIVDLVTSMPPQIKFKGGKAKHVFKKAVASLLPEGILQRKDKMGFPVPLNEWLRDGPVRDFVSDTLLSQRCRERGLFKPDAMVRMIEKEQAYGRQLWGVLCLELWHQTFIDA